VFADVCGLRDRLALARFLTRQIRQLVSATAVISQGDLTRKVELNSRDEIGELANRSMRCSRASEHRLRGPIDQRADLRIGAGAVRTAGHVNSTRELAGAARTIARGR
jgi:methyl-accepting chemotaxis protein